VGNQPQESANRNREISAGADRRQGSTWVEMRSRGRR
jgi:hypothetical protein